MKREIVKKAVGLTMYKKSPAGLTRPFGDDEYVIKKFGRAKDNLICDYTGESIKIGEEVCAISTGKNTHSYYPWELAYIYGTLEEEADFLKLQAEMLKE